MSFQRTIFGSLELEKRSKFYTLCLQESKQLAKTSEATFREKLIFRSFDYESDKRKHIEAGEVREVWQRMLRIHAKGSMWKHSKQSVLKEEQTLFQEMHLGPLFLQ